MCVGQTELSWGHEMVRLIGVESSSNQGQTLQTKSHQNFHKEPSKSGVALTGAGEGAQSQALIPIHGPPQWPPLAAPQHPLGLGAPDVGGESVRTPGILAVLTRVGCSLLSANRPARPPSPPVTTLVEQRFPVPLGG